MIFLLEDIGGVMVFIFGALFGMFIVFNLILLTFFKVKSIGHYFLYLMLFVVAMAAIISVVAYI